MSKEGYIIIPPYQMVLSEAMGGKADSLASEDLIDLRPGAEVRQKHLVGSLCEDVRLHAVILK